MLVDISRFMKNMLLVKYLYIHVCMYHLHMVLHIQNSLCQNVNMMMSCFIVLVFMVSAKKSGL